MFCEIVQSYKWEEHSSHVLLIICYNKVYKSWKDGVHVSFQTFGVYTSLFEVSNIYLTLAMDISQTTVYWAKVEQPMKW